MTQSIHDILYSPGGVKMEDASERLYQQIKGQAQNLGTEKYFKTGAAGTKEGGLGSVDAVYKDMAKKLASAGLTSIEDLGQARVPVYRTVTAIPEQRINPDGKQIWNSSTGEYEYEMEPTGRWFYKNVVDTGEGSYDEPPTYLSEEEIKNANLQGGSPKQAKVLDKSFGSGYRMAYINKATGEEIPEFSNVKGGGWGRQTAGDGQTIYSVQFDPQTGLPIFYNQQTHGKQEYADLLKVAAIGAAIFAPQIGAAIAPTLSAGAQLAIGSAISGLVGSGGDLKEGIKAGLASYLGGQAGSWASKASNSALVGNIASNMTRTAILGGDMEQALVSSLAQAAPTQLAKQIPGFADLPRAAQEAAVKATVDLMRTGGDNLEAIATQGAASGLTDYALGNIEGYKDLRPTQQNIIRNQVSSVLTGKDIGKAALDAAIQFGSESVRNTTKSGLLDGEEVEYQEGKFGPGATDFDPESAGLVSTGDTGYYDEITGDFIETGAPGFSRLDDTSGIGGMEGWTFDNGVWIDPEGLAYYPNQKIVSEKPAAPSYPDSPEFLVQPTPIEIPEIVAEEPEFPEMVVTAPRLPDIPDPFEDYSIVPPREPEFPEMVITAQRPEPEPEFPEMVITAPRPERPELDLSDLLEPAPITPSPIPIPEITAPPAPAPSPAPAPAPAPAPQQAVDWNALLTLLGGMQQQASPYVLSVPENSADIKLMEDIFGTSLSAPSTGTDQDRATELARLLRS